MNLQLPLRLNVNQAFAIPSGFNGVDLGKGAHIVVKGPILLKILERWMVAKSCTRLVDVVDGLSHYNPIQSHYLQCFIVANKYQLVPGFPPAPQYQKIVGKSRTAATFFVNFHGFSGIYFWSQGWLKSPNGKRKRCRSPIARKIEAEHRGMGSELNFAMRK